MKYEVDQKFLSEYKWIFERYSYHLTGCSYFTVEVCDCGYSADIKRLQILEKETVKPIKENHEQNQY